MQHQITFLDTRGGSVRFSCRTEQAISRAAEEAGVLIRIACDNGGCGACQAEMQSGAIRYLAPISEKQRRDRRSGELRYELLCRAVPTEDTTFLIRRPWRRINRQPMSNLLAQLQN
ncbi:MAG: 2Fe-2S iron-sulfur cluster binding domain-containing protein [Gammaproteobacteria bacterium]|nr:2Fe-2S iron-sulfur cluster binding domain-containing protein [Gammaproteobacteria bacterium]